MLITHSISLFVTLGLLAPTEAASQVTPTATVRVVAVDPSGKAVEQPHILEFMNTEAARVDFQPAFAGMVGSHIPYGKYRLAVIDEVTGSVAETIVEVESAEIFMKLGLRWSGIESDGPAPNAFRGKVVGRTSSRGDSCRASGVYLRSQYDSELTVATESFDFGAVWPGLYTVECVIKGKLLHFGPVDIKWSTPPIVFRAPSVSAKNVKQKDQRR